MVHEVYNGSQNHVGLLTDKSGDGTYIHGNLSSKVKRSVGLYGSFRKFEMPYYRLEVWYIANADNAKMFDGTTKNASGYVVGKYTEERGGALASGSSMTSDNGTFQGWATNSSGTGKITNISTSQRGRLKVYETWSGGNAGTDPDPTPTPTPDPEPTPPPASYSVRLYTYGGSVSHPEYWTTTANQLYTGSYTYPSAKALPSGSQMYRRGYTFNTWYNEDYSQSGLTEKAESCPEGDYTFRAGWTPNVYPYRLHTNGATITSSYYTSRLTQSGDVYTGRYTYDRTESLPAASDMYKRGHDFRGWYLTSDFSSGYRTSINPGDIGTMDFYARWTPSVYKIVLHGNGGTITNPRIDNATISGDTATGTYTYGNPVYLPEAPGDIHRDGAIFAGWFSESNHSGSLKTYQNNDTINEQHYYARWINIENYPGGTVNSEIDKATGTMNVYINAIKKTGARELIYPNTNVKKVAFKTVCLNSGVVDKNVIVMASTKSDAKKAFTSLGALCWPITSDKGSSYIGGDKYKFKDSSTGYIKLPNNIGDKLGKDGILDIYVHIMSPLGQTKSVHIKFIRRIVYG